MRNICILGLRKQHFPKMKTKKVYLLLCILIMALFTVSCVEDLDFDQVEDVVLTPVYEVDFIYSTFDTREFIDPNIDPSITIPQVAVDDTLNYDLLGTDFIVDNLERVELTFEFRNTIERDFDLTFGFLNDAGSPIGPIYNLTALAGNGEGTEPVVTTEVIVLDSATINVLGAATKLVSVISVNNVNSALQGILEIRSKGSYFINYEL